MIKRKFSFFLIAEVFLIFLYSSVWGQGIKPSVLEKEVLQLEKEVADLERQTIERRKLQFTNKVLDSLEIRNNDMMDVFKLIESRSGLRIICNEPFHQTVNIFLKDVNAFDALRIILSRYGLAYEQLSSSTVSVMPESVFQSRYGVSFRDQVQMKEIRLKQSSAEQAKEIFQKYKNPLTRIVVNADDQGLIFIDESFSLNGIEELMQKIDVKVETKTIKVYNRKVGDIVKDITPLLTEYVGYVAADLSEKAITITDTPQRLLDLESFIRQADNQEEKILLEIHVAQILLNEEHQEGIDWKAILSQYESMDYKNFWQDQSLDVLKWGIVLVEDYPVLIEALETVGTMRTLFKGSQEMSKDEKFPVMIQPQKKIDLLHENKDEVFLNSSENFSVVFNYIATRDQDVVLNFQPHRNKLTTFPEVRIPKGSLLVLGGFFVKTDVQSTKKFPVLSSIPLFGTVFQSQKTDTRQSEVIIFVTPQFIREDVGPYAR